ncbi:RNA polymerase sigma factor [uncultured Sanguibacteroides sp.]|uniref:RNA polymerase sigma factor n=1 Tax=uncultured Sanguibacteroides sp. TaxID=1635151 RepID=UPI0025D31383|nr:RNA polymerase sigma factor [uncultured Sanguibacteroides sp.]
MQQIPLFNVIQTEEHDMSNYKTILQNCRKREKRAQLEFYSLFYKSVYNSCFRILGNPQDSEEVMQETFLKVLDKIERYEGEAENMERILKRIAINHAIDLCRKRKIRFVEITETTDCCEEEAENEEEELQLEAIHRMMQQLPQGYRMILNLHLIEGFDYNEIAKQLELSPSTIRSQFVRAKQKLIELIKKNYCYESFVR